MKFSSAHLWQLLLILGVTVALRAPSVSWGIKHNDTFQIDETQHIGIAKNLAHKLDDQKVGRDSTSRQWNAKGFATQLTFLALPTLDKGEAESMQWYYTGRWLSIFYSVLLSFLIYGFSYYLFGKHQLALLAGLLISVFDLNVTYSHYALPDAPVLFWSYLAVFSIYWAFIANPDNTFYRGRWSLWLIALSIAMAMIFKFDIIPFMVLLGTMALVAFKKRIHWSEALATLFTLGILIPGFVYVFTAFDLSLSEMFETKERLVKENKNVVGMDNHWVNNPIQYTFALLAGTSAPAFLFAIAGFVGMWFRNVARPIRSAHILLVSYLTLTFLLLWSGDCTFVRRALVFLPYLAVCAAYGLVSFQAATFTSPGLRILQRAAIPLVLGYTLLLTVFSQLNFVSDTRYEARDYIIEQGLDQQSLAYSRYARLHDLPPGPRTDLMGRLRQNTIVLHEQQYGRYFKSFTTPFIIPENHRQVYHCKPMEWHNFPKLMRGDLDYTLAKTFSVQHPLPERKLFKHLFGTYETSLGDVKVFVKNTTPAE